MDTVAEYLPYRVHKLHYRLQLKSADFQHVMSLLVMSLGLRFCAAERVGQWGVGGCTWVWL